MTVPTDEPARASLERAIQSSLAAWPGEAPGTIVAKMAPSLRRNLEPRPRESRAAALDALAFDHAAEARFDPARVHPTWWVRALTGESEAVRRTVARHAPKAVSQAVRLAFGLDDEAIQPDRQPDPLAERWVLSLWSERLLGGPPPRDDDPLVVRAVATANRHSIKTLLKSTAQVKRDSVSQAGPIAETDARLLKQAQKDIIAYDDFIYRDFSTLGLVTIGRLLAEVEPFRTRWTVQHLPYPAAKFARSLQREETRELSREELLAWERRNLTIATESGTARA